LSYILSGSTDSGPINYLTELSVESDMEFLWYKNKSDLIEGKDIKLVITGTSLGDSIDKKLIRHAKKNNITSVSIIEHWSWYKKRFELNGNLILPDHIIVNDDYARVQAINDGLPAGKIFVGGNPYLDNLSKSKLSDVDVETWKKKNNFTGKKIILFITEALKNSFPLDSDDYLGYDEFKVLNDIIEILPGNSALLLKIHPEEEGNKYEHLQSDQVRVINQMSIDEMTQIPNTIIGMASMLLIELGMFRDDIISYRPNARKGFVGEKIGATHYAETKSQLKNYLLDPPSFSAMPFREKFDGSGKRISKFLESLL